MRRLRVKCLEQLSGWAGPFRLAVIILIGAAAPSALAQLANDNFSSPIVLTNSYGWLPELTTGATTEPGEPAHADTTSGASVWFQWTAPFTGTMEFDTDGSYYNTVLAVYTGSSLAGLAPVAANISADNFFFNPFFLNNFNGFFFFNFFLPALNSQVVFPVTAGTVYQIAVADVNAFGGYLVLNWHPSGAAYGGTFGFAVDPQNRAANVPSATYFISEWDSFSPGNPYVAYSTIPGHVTINRRVGTAGKVLVNYTITNAFYTNIYYTNVVALDIFSTNLSDGTYTNSFTTNIMSYTTVYNFVSGQFISENFTNDGTGITITNSSAGNSMTVTNIGVIFTNSPDCRNVPISDMTTKTITATNALYIESFCSTIIASNLDFAAIPYQDYTPVKGTAAFIDYQMSTNINLNVSPLFFSFAGLTLNRALLVTIDSVMFDPLEDTNNLAPPTISTNLGSAFVDILSTEANPQANGFLPTNTVFNFERSTWQVTENTGPFVNGSSNQLKTATIWVMRTGTNFSGGASCDYTIDFLDGPRLPNANDQFPLQPGSDYATPTNSIPSSAQAPDFFSQDGTVTWGANDGQLKPITITITNDSLVEFNEDIVIRLGNINHQNNGVQGGVIGWVNAATLTILFDDQPAGAVDRTHNPDNNLNSSPPNNQAPGANSTVYAVALQPDGKTVMGGDFTTYNTKPRNRVARMNFDGSLDTTFLAAPNSGADGVVTTLKLDSSGKIIIGGGFNSFNGQDRHSIARLNSDGTLDGSFSPGAGFNGLVWAVVLQSDGKLLVGGNFASINNTNRNFLARLNTDGSVDATFDPGSELNGSVNAVALQADGRIIVGGDFTSVGGGGINHIARLNSDGSLDTSFNPGSGPDNSVYTLALQSDGRIIAGGSFSTINAVSENKIARFNGDGSLDSGLDVGTGPNDTVYSAILQPDGSILLGGFFNSINGTRRVGIARLLPYGPVDTSFMDTAYNQFAGLINHYANEDVEPRNFVLSIALQPDGNVIIGGGFHQLGGGSSSPWYDPFGGVVLGEQFAISQRDDISHRSNVARLIGGSTPGPGNLQFAYDSYNAAENGGSLYVSLVRTNGSLGVVNSAFGPTALQPGPGSAVYGTDFTFDSASANPTWQTTWGGASGTGSFITWMVQDGLTGPNFHTIDVLGQPFQYLPSPADVYVGVLEDPATFGNLGLNLNLSYPQINDSFFLGGENIPLGTALGSTTVPMTIVDNKTLNGVIGFSSANYTVNENGANATITVTRTNGSAGLVTVQYATSNGTAIAGTTNDYLAVSGRLNFNPGELSKTFSVPIINNTVVAPDKTVNLRLFNVTGGGQAGLTNAVLTIINDNLVSGHVSFGATNFTAHEIAGSATITATRLGGSSGALSVQYATSDGSAVNGVNYTGSTNALTWNNGDTAVKSFVVPVFDDGIVASNKTVNLRLFNAVINGTTTNNNVLVTPPTNATLTIINDDAFGSPSFSTANYEVNENAGFVNITVIRTGGSAQSFSVDYTTVDGTAFSNPGSGQPDYTSTSGALTFGPGEFTKTITVPIIDNTIQDGNRFFSIQLSNPQPSSGPGGGVSLGFPSLAVVTIIDDETYNQPAGSGDPIFDANASFNGNVNALALEYDGKILAGGDFTVANNVLRNGIARLNSDGTLDARFSSPIEGVNGSVRALVSQTDGRVLFGGLFTTVNGVNRNYLARLNYDGSIDSSFVTGSGADNPVYALAEKFVGGTNLIRKLIVGGSFASINGVARGGIAQLNNDGAVDSAFNPTGANGTVYAVAVYSTNDVINGGKILIGGDFTTVNGSARAHVARLNTDGTLDATFDPGAGPGDSVRAMAIQIDGRVVIGGLFTNVDGAILNHIARLNGNGALDSNFNPGVGANDLVNCIAIQEDQKIVFGGAFTRANGVTRNRFTRINSDGTLDPAINFGLGADSFVAAMLVQPDDKFVLGGGFTTFDGLPAAHIARLFGLTTPGLGAFEFVSANFQVNENATNSLITVRRRGGTGDFAAGANATVVFSTSDGTGVSGTDYLGATNTLNFPVGETLATATVPIIDNFQVGSNKTVNLLLSNPAPVGTILGNQPIATLTIINVNSDVSFSTSAFTVNKNVAGGNAIISLVRNGSSVGPVSLDFSTTGTGNALPGVDYTPVNTTVVFADGQTNQIASVPIINNGLVEGNTTVGLALSNPNNTFVVNPSTAVLTIVDNNRAPGKVAFAAGNYSVLETGTNAVITLIRTNGSSGQISVQFATTGGTATPGVDYAPTTNNVVFADGEISKTFNIPVFHNPLAQGNQTVNITLSNPTGGAAILGTNTATLTIIDVDTGLAFSTSAYFVNELGGSVNVTVQRVGGTNSAVSVQYSTTNGTARANIDYVPVSGSLSFAPGETIKSFAVSVLHNPQVTGNQIFFVQLSNPSNGVLGNPSTATVTVIDDDSGLSFSSATYTVSKAGTNAVISVVRTGSTAGTISVNFAVANSTAQAGVDYVATNGTLTFPDGVTAGTFTVPIINNAIVEGNLTASLALSSPGGGAQLLSPASATLTIIDVNSGLSFSSSAYTVNENGVNAPVTVVRTGVTNTAVSVHFTTADGTAQAGLEYLPTNGVLSFASGETVKTFNVPVIDDNIVQGNKTVLLTLSSAAGPSVFLLSPNAATLNIVDNDTSFVIPAGAALIHESITPTNGVIDPGETVTLLFGLRNVSGGNTTNLVATLLATNGVTAPSGPQNYGVLVQGGPSASRQFSFTASGTNGGSITAVLQLQDGAQNLGTANFSYAIGATTNSFANTNLITIIDDAPATNYPANIAVSGLNGAVNKVTATLSRLNHANIADVNILLVGPAGQKEILMGHAGGNTAVSNATVTFDDAAAASIPTSGLSSGTYKPTQSGVAATYPSPAPGGPYGTNLSGFIGSNPNGTWSLFVLDNQALDNGAISNGWSLTFSTFTPVPAAADLVVGLTASPNPVILTSNLTYTIAVTNFGPSPATGVSVTNFLPTGVSFVSANASQGTTSVSGGAVVCNVGALAKDANVTITIVGAANSPGSITNTVSAAANEADPYTGDNTVSAVNSVNIPQADLAIGMVDAPNPIFVGNTLTYSLAITNFGPATAIGVMLTNTLPPGVGLVSASSSQGTNSNASGLITFSLGALNSGATASATLVVQPKFGGTITNSASIVSSVNDPLKGNNSASVKTVVQWVPLTVATSAGNLTFSWPAQAAGYVLQSTTSLTPPVVWTPVTNPAPQVINGQNTVTITPGSGLLFFRLSAQVQ
jgi:uncharacterized delta-60 repeat protein/uncharacterized repeat protein (TIGR01451 family)